MLYLYMGDKGECYLDFFTMSSIMVFDATRTGTLPRR